MLTKHQINFLFSEDIKYIKKIERMENKPVTVIDKAKELLETLGSDSAIKYFSDKIVLTPRSFQEVCNNAGYTTAIKWIHDNSK